jgi:hypothetical protein
MVDGSEKVECVGQYSLIQNSLQYQKNHWMNKNLVLNA